VRAASNGDCVPRSLTRSRPLMSLPNEGVREGGQDGATLLRHPLTRANTLVIVLFEDDILPARCHLSAICQQSCVAGRDCRGGRRLRRLPCRRTARISLALPVGRCDERYRRDELGHRVAIARGARNGTSRTHRSAMRRAFSDARYRTQPRQERDPPAPRGPPRRQDRARSPHNVARADNGENCPPPRWTILPVESKCGPVSPARCHDRRRAC